MAGISLHTTRAAPKAEEFTADGTWTKPSNVEWIDVILVGGGGGGGGSDTGAESGGGGGGGQVMTRRKRVTDNVTVVIGDGGAGGAAGDNDGNGNDRGRATASRISERAGPDATRSQRTWIGPSGWG